MTTNNKSPAPMQAQAPSRSMKMAWLVWSLAASFYCYGFFQRVAPSVMVDELMRDFAAGGAILGNLSAFYFYAYAGLQLPVGIMMDRWGPRRLLSIAALIAGAGSLLFATAETLIPAYAGRLMIGAGVAFTFIGTLKLAATWFPPRRFAMLSGLTLMLGMAGGVGGQSPLAALVSATGWRDTMIWAAVFALFLGAVIWLVVRDHPAEGTIATPAPRKNDSRRLLDGLMATIKTPQTWVIGLFGGMMTAPMLAFGALWGVPYLMTAYDLDRPVAAASLSLMLIGTGIGSPLAGWLSDHIHSRKIPMIVSATGGTICFSILVYAPGLPLLAAQVLLLLNGIMAGGMIVAFVTAREHNLHSAEGATLGMTNTMFMASGAIFQPLIGWLLDLNWDGNIETGVRIYSLATFQTALSSLVVCGIVGIIAALMVRETHCRYLRE